MRALIYQDRGTYTIVPTPTAVPARYVLEDAVQLSGVEARLILHYCQLGLIISVCLAPGVEPIFDEQALVELRRLDHFRRRHHLDMDVLPFVWDLWQQVHLLESERDDLRRRLRQHF